MNEILPDYDTFSVKRTSSLGQVTQNSMHMACLLNVLLLQNKSTGTGNTHIVVCFYRLQDQLYIKQGTSLDIVMLGILYCGVYGNVGCIIMCVCNHVK